MFRNDLRVEMIRKQIFGLKIMYKMIG
jgi:hypothetical protein